MTAMARRLLPNSADARFIQSVTKPPFFPLSSEDLKRRFGHGSETYGLFLAERPRPVTYCHMATMREIPRHIGEVLGNTVPLRGATHGVMYTLQTVGRDAKGKGCAPMLGRHILQEAQRHGLESLTTMSPYDHARYNAWCAEGGKLAGCKTLVEYLARQLDPVYRYHTSNGATFDCVLQQQHNNEERMMVRYRYY